MQTDAPVLDDAALGKFQELGGDDFGREMVEMFFGYAVEKLGIAKQAMTDGKLTEVEPAIHPLKTSAGHVDAEAMKFYCQEIECNARDESWDSIGELLTRVEQSYAEVPPRLEARVAG